MNKAKKLLDYEVEIAKINKIMNGIYLTLKEIKSAMEQGSITVARELLQISSEIGKVMAAAFNLAININISAPEIKPNTGRNDVNAR